jgi:murein DD-endopeptidase MepM/ murein hydrolase activator NlpD
VSAQDQKVIGIVRRARADAIATERRLDRLERRQRLITQAVAARRDEIVSVKQGVIDARAGLDRARAGKRGTLARVRGQRHELEEDLGALEREQARVRAALQRAATGFAAVAGGGSGAMIWPVSGPITGSFGEARPGHMHAGLDIAAPTGTPIRAARAGRVVLAAWTGGYGNYTCIQHTASLATCYAHQSSYGTSVGAAVAQGQVIGYVGNTGHSFGSHLHFEVRVGGAPVSPLAYL